MFPFWDSVIAQVLRAARPRRVVEIGALRGETTVLLFEALGPHAELHVIDPAPEFDPAEHEEKFPGQYVFHRDISHRVLPRLPPVDVALVDGDHNWFTVYHELRMLAATARRSGRPLPVLVMHDVGWPYGRRDLYYAPERIPEEHRQPHRRRGMMPGRSALLAKPGFGLNAQLHNAEHEGGPRNGVMTALDDFATEHPEPLRRIVIPVYFGLAVVAEERRLAADPELAAVFEGLESAAVRLELLELGERLRIDDLAFQHNAAHAQHRQLQSTSAHRYLELLKGALLDLHHLANEVRVDYLYDCARRGTKPDPAVLRDPERELRQSALRLREARRAGAREVTPNALSAIVPYTQIGRVRLDHLESLLEELVDEEIAGDLVECGPGRGGAGVLMRGFLEAYELTDRTVWVADTFRARGDAADGADPVGSLRADLNQVRDAYSRFDLLDDRVRFLQGDLTDTLPVAPIGPIALLRVDASNSVAGTEALEALYGRVVEGGFVVVDGIGADAAAVVDEFVARRGLTEVIEQVDDVARVWRKADPSVSVKVEGAKERHHAPLAPSAPQEAIDLSVVVVFYNMRREAERTLRSLSRAYQRGIEDLDYEVIVVDNGSAPEQVVDRELVTSFGPEFRSLVLGEDATPSPARALNRGVEIARGDVVAFMIDGAHVLTPGVLHYARLAFETYAPAIAVVQQWFVGPGQQGEAMLTGYDQEFEDRLFEEIEWPVDGYRLFEIGHAVGGRDWFDGLFESNCLFVPRNLLEQVGALDESFSMPGGGYANLDLYERLGATPGVKLVKVLGEASFHQVHGGTTTNQPDPQLRGQRLISYRQHYDELRGRRYRGPRSSSYYIGSMVPAAKRTHARRLVAPTFFRRASRGGPDGRPEQPEPIPEELRTEFVDAFYRSLVWQEWRWLGRPVRIAPTDAIAYQEVLAATKPEWVVDVGTSGGGRALFLASICELLGHGRVVSIDERGVARVPEHDRLAVVTGEPTDDDVRAAVAELVGGDRRAMLVLGLRSRQRLLQAFDAYASYVAVGSYAVLEDTIVNGNPVWPSFGPGPADAARTILQARDDFVADPSLEKLGLTFNPGGYLKRIR